MATETRAWLSLSVANHVRQQILSKLQCGDDLEKRFILDADQYHIIHTYADELFALERWTASEKELVKQSCFQILCILIWINAVERGLNIREVFFGPSDLNLSVPAISDEDLYIIDQSQLDFLGAEKLQKDFMEQQYIFKPYRLSEERPTRIITVPDRARLPFMTESWIGDGGYGVVFKVEIPVGYLTLCDHLANATNSFVALKRVDFKSSFTTELKNLGTLKESLKHHKHISTHHLSFLHGTTLNLISPLAELGNLEVFLNEGIDNTPPAGLRQYFFHNRFNRFQHNGVRRNWDLLSQMAGIADAISWMHYGSSVVIIHGDLKPTHILIKADSVSSVGHWQVSDFLVAGHASRRNGITTLSGLNLLSKAQDEFYTLPRRPPRTFQAPEIENWSLGKNSDVWSLACIGTEVLTFALGGSRLVQGFRKARLESLNDYFYSVVDEPTLLEPQKSVERHALVVRPSVLDWLTKLTETNAKWVQCYARILLGALVIDMDARISSEELKINMKHAASHCNAFYGAETHRDYMDSVCPNLKAIQSTKSKAGMTDWPRHFWDEINTRTQFENTADYPRMQSALVPSDSGYASELPPQSNTTSGGAKLETIEQAPMEYGHSPKAHYLGLIDNLALPSISENTSSFEIPNTKGPASIHNLEKTNYSASLASSILRPVDSAFSNELAMLLLEKIVLYTNDKSILERLGRMLPDLLRAFAFKLGYQPVEPALYEISAWIHKRRRRVQNAYEERLTDYLPDSVLFRDQAERDFVINRFFSYNGGDEYEDVPMYEPIYSNNVGMTEDIEEEEEEIEEVEGEFDTSHYRRSIIESPAFTWLVASLRRESTLQRQNPDVFEGIRLEISRYLRSPRFISRYTSVKPSRAIFAIDGNLIAFVREQRYQAPASDVIQYAITLTGTANDAQAASVTDYLAQTWPTTGSHVARFMSNVVQPSLRLHHAVLPDGTRVEGWVDEGKDCCFACVEGPVESIIEFGQQLAWIGAALQSSPFPQGVASCTPYIDRIYSVFTESCFEAEIKCEFRFKIHAEPDKQLPGWCWHQMFLNPVIVAGFPIRVKPPGLGVEMPLNMLPFFAGADYITQVNGHIFLKGYSTLLSASKIINDLLIWHFEFSPGQQRIPYPDSSTKGEEVSFSQLEGSRHVIGWCTGCSYKVGDDIANYDIRRSQLPRPGVGMLLEKISISGGFYAALGITIIPGAKDFGPHLSRDGYNGMLRWMKAQYVIFWDDIEARGWLVNGTSALLHLVRASLWKDSNESYSEGFEFDTAQLQPPNSPNTPLAALEVLKNEKNRKLKIEIARIEVSDEIELDRHEPPHSHNAPAGETQHEGRHSEKPIPKERRIYYTFEDRVKRIASILDALMDHQQKLGGERGIKMKGRVRTHLEGWSFTDVVNNRDPRPGVVALRNVAYGWINLVRSLNAVTLFGRNYGELIVPHRESLSCSQWMQLPKKQYYLAASTTDLKAMMHEEGTEAQNFAQKFYRASSKTELCRVFRKERGQEPPQLVDGYLWHSPINPFGRCPCQDENMFQEHHSPVQIIYHLSSRKLIPLRIPTSILEGGAVIFGHNPLFPYRLGSGGDDDFEDGEPNDIESASLEQSYSELNTVGDAETPIDSSRASESTPITLHTSTGGYVEENAELTNVLQQKGNQLEHERHKVDDASSALQRSDQPTKQRQRLAGLKRNSFFKKILKS